MSIILRIGAVRANSYCADSLHSGQDAASSDTDAQDFIASEDSYKPVPTYPGCFGLPYQDHNYGAPPPLSPPPPPPRSPTPPPPYKVSIAAELEEEAKIPTVSNEEEVVEDSITRCICGFLHDDGFMICCDKCSVWQHIDCMNIDRNNIPDKYCCEICEPRLLDVERARAIQLRRRHELDPSATDSDPEEPANALASLGGKPVPAKAKAGKPRRVAKSGARLLKPGKLAKSPHSKRDKKLKLTKKEKENMKDASKKQKILKSGIKTKKLKRKLNQSQSQNEIDAWSVDGPLLNIEAVKENEYSPEVMDFLSRVKTNGIHSPHIIGVFPEELMVRLYQVVDVKPNCKGLEATDLIAPGRAVIDYKGKVMLRQHYQPDPFRNESESYVLYYSKFEGLDLCIDASAFGGDARFIRRSCNPNAEMCHIIDNGKLLFIVQAKKEIAKGSEITIPFDFSYQESLASVECACGRPSCQVIRSRKRFKLAQKSPDKVKRKRQASGEGRVRRNSMSKSSPSKTVKSPLKTSPVKSPIAALPLCIDEPIVSVVDGNSNEDIQVGSPVRSGSLSRRASRAGLEVKEDKDVKVSKTAVVVKSAVLSPADVHTPTATACTAQASESEADSAGECPKKLTREEKKLQDIMKYFEKIEKREERRKEALARLDHKKHVKTDSTEVVPESSPPVCESLPTPAPTNQFLDIENKIVIKLEDPTSAESPQKHRLKKAKRKRRSSRVMSALEPLCSSPQPPKPICVVPEEAPPPPVSPVPEEIKVKEEPVEQTPVTSFSTPSATSAPALGFESPSQESDSYVFHKKKKYLFNERCGSRSSESRTESTETQDGEEEMFVAYTATSRNSMDNMPRRNSTSASFGRPCDSAKGNAKKRWLRQAMHETPLAEELVEAGHTSPAGSTSPPHTSTPAPLAPVAAPLPSLHSPSLSPSDYATPLKKRRLAPEYLPSTSFASQAATNQRLTGETGSSDIVQSGTSALSLTPTGIHLLNSLPQRGACRFSSISRNGFVISENQVFVENRLLTAKRTVRMESEAQSTVTNQGELSMDGLSSSNCYKLSCLAGAGHAASVAASADSLAAECSSNSFGGAPSSSLCQENDSGIEMPLVDSSGAVLDPDLPETAQQRVRGSDSISVCSSDNEVSMPCVQSAGNEQQTGCGASASEPEAVSESSSAYARDASLMFCQQDTDVSESQQSEEPVVAEEEGNEASGSVSESEELSIHASTSAALLHLSAECQVNSSQDCTQMMRPALDDSTHCRGEVDCNNSVESLSTIDRTCDSLYSTENAEMQDNSNGERSGVSSAQDVASVSSRSAALDTDNSLALEMECGPSSSTQVFRSSRCVYSSAEDLVCNSSDVSEFVRGASVAEDGSVDSTTQNSCAGGMAMSRCDIVDSHLQAADSNDSYCDSNSDEKLLSSTASAECAGVSSSSQGDSHCNEVADSGVGTVYTSSSLVSSSASVTSSLSGGPHRDSSAAGTQVSSMGLASSALSTAHSPDGPSPSPSQGGFSPGAAYSCRGVDSASGEPSALHITSTPDMDSRDLDSVGSSAPRRLSMWQCDSEASTSGLDRRLSDEGDSNRPGCSGFHQRDGDATVSSAVGGLEGLGDRVLANGDLGSSMSLSSFSEDSSGSNSTGQPCATVSSSEAQSVPAAARRKVSLSEYRNRRKDQRPSSCSSTSPKNSLSENHRSTRRVNSACLAPLPLFEPVTINSAHREPEDKLEKPPMSLADRLRIEFGLETGTSEEDDQGSSTGFKKSSKDIPPPPPPLPNGGVIGTRRPSSSGAKAGCVENEEESRTHKKSPLANSASNLSSAPYATVNGSASCQPPVQQSGCGLSWLAKLHSAVTSSTPSMALPTAPLPSPTGLFAATTALPQQLYNNGPVRSGIPHLLNGSNAPSQVGAAFSSCTLFPARQGQPLPTGQPQSFSPALKAQQAPPPPPPPSATFPLVAQSRTHLTQQGHAGPCGSLTRTQHLAPGTSTVATGSHSARLRHSSGEALSSSSSSSSMTLSLSSNHPQGHCSYYNQDRQVVKRKGSYSEKKRH